MSRKDKRQNRQSGSSGAPERRAESVAIASDDREPVAENRPVPVLLIAALVVLPVLLRMVQQMREARRARREAETTQVGASVQGPERVGPRET